MVKWKIEAACSVTVKEGCFILLVQNVLPHCSFCIISVCLI
jgi:hypothetical protein